MPSTNGKTKNCNTYRFKSFADRVSEIDIRQLALYHIGHQNEELSEDNETYFHQTLNKWVVLNLSEEFSHFSRKFHKIVTLPQLIHQKEFVVDQLLNHLSTATNLSLQPVLELLYVLAKDLREEFYPYFQRVLDRLISLLNTQDAEQLEWTLVCLAYLFKTLKPYLKKNIGVIFHSILPLLDEQHYDEHITNFAVECFSYIARDLRDYRKFIEFMLDAVTCERTVSVQGCGRLLFEIMRGVKGSFHSTASDFLQIVLEALVDDQQIADQKSQLLCDIVYCAIREVLKFIQPQQVTLLWTKLCSVAKTATSSTKLINLIQMFLLTAQFRDGRFLSDLATVVPIIMQVIDKCAEENKLESLQLLSKLASSILMANNAQVSQLDTSLLLNKMLTVPQRDVYEEFVLQIVHHPQFEILVLAKVIKYFEEHSDLRAYELMAQIVLKKQPLAVNTTNLSSWKVYPIQSRSAQSIKQIEEKLKQLDLLSENIEEQLLLLILAPHLSALKKDSIEERLKFQSQKLLEKLESKDQLHSNIFMFALIVETQIHLKFAFSKDFLRAAVNALLPSISDFRALSCVDQLLDQSPALFANDVNLLDQLRPLISFHKQNVRLTVAHCLCTLHREAEKTTPYRIFYDAEQIKPDVQTYRELLLQLQKLETSSELFKSIKQDVYKVDILRFLLGMLYHNFKFIWEPVQKLIEEYAKSLGKDDFWKIYKEKLEETLGGIDYSIEKNQSAFSLPDYWKSSTLNELAATTVLHLITQQELLNYRNLLWMRLANYGQIAEVKNRDLVTFFLNFVNDEYRKNLERREYTWDLSIESADQQQLDEVDDDEEGDLDETGAGSDAENESMGTKIVVKKRPRKQRNKRNATAKSILQTLQGKMNIFVAQPNPKALYREAELYSFYMDLLAGPNPQLQKIALDCVMAYKIKALLPYKDQLYAIIDERKFKDELINFKLDTVNPEYRGDLMKILLRLLYGKMITKGNQRSVGSQVRKSLIIRFLGQCSTDEIFWFMQMAFGRYDKYTNADVKLDNVPALVSADFTLNAVWSPKKLQNIVNLLELVRKEFGGLMDTKFHIYTLKLLTFVGSVCLEVMQSDVNKMHAKIPVVFKNIKNVALLSLANFFAHISHFDWEPLHIQCLTEIFVWPAIEKLPVESIHTPTALMKLLLQWGEQPRHFRFLNQSRSTGGKVIFAFLIELLLNEKAKQAVRGPILSLIERILLTVSSLKDATAAEQDEAGLAIIKPFIPEILKRLKMNFSTRSAKQAIDKRDLNILSMLTGHVKEPETCDSLLELLLPILIARSQSNASEDVICQVITTLANLIKCLDAPETYLLKIAPLFEQVQEVVARKMLCNLVMDIAKKRHKQSKESSEISVELCDRLRNIGRLVMLLNAWDKRWVEQPDYEKRLDALKEVKQLADSDSVDMDLGVLVIYNCFYFLKYDKDMGLRDNAAEHLKFLVPKLINKYSSDKVATKYLVDDIMLNILRRIIRDSNDNVRSEGIRLLGELARECPKAHPVLEDLSPLGNKQDEEVDFFENLTHLQAHRHGRALLKFCSHATTLTRAPNARTLTQFVLPLASHYLLKEKYASKHAVIDAAIEAVGVVCQLLPWQQYHTVLRYYLMKMRVAYEYQKQSVRLVVRVLDAFHFDLSQSRDDIDTLKQLKDKLIDKLGVDASTGAGSDQTNDVVIKKVDTEFAGDLSMADENLDENLDSRLEESSDAEADSEENPNLDFVLKKSLLLPPNASKRVMTTITTTLIPTLNRAITEKSSYDVKHKVNRKRLSAEREEEEIQRVPIALALVKLMQKLPKELLDTGLPGVFMKVCTFLRSPLKSVRMLTRDILRKIMQTVGSSYLAMLIEHLQTLLTRGFQVHVLSVTVHGVLDALRDAMKPEDIEACLQNLLDVTLNDIFGDVTAEKEVEKIAAHTPEAKPSAKSYLVLHIIARNIRENCLLDFLMPFKDHLARSHSRKMTQKIQDCFGKMVAGLVENPHISCESLLIFIYGTVSESITDLLPGTKKRILTESDKEKMRRARPDCYLIQPEPKMRSGAVNRHIKTNTQANAHILIEFGLEMLHYELKRKKLHEIEYQPFLNPLLPLVKDALKSTHARVTTFALKCFASMWNENYEIDALQEHLIEVVDRLFEILKNFSTFGASKQEDNLQLVRSAFKVVVAFLRKCVSYDLSLEQIDQLVLFIDQDLYEGENQHLSFALLKALLVRHVDTRGLHNVMTRLRELTITSQSDYVRDETRTMLITYIMEYPLNKRVDQLLKFFSTQLCYSLPAGRLSAITFLTSIIKKFPVPKLSAHAEFLYLSLGTRLVNDDDSGCRKAVADCIELLINRLDKPDRARLFDVTLLFFDEVNKSSVREMAALLCSRFLNVEKQGFAARLKLVLPLLVSSICTVDPNQPGRFVRAVNGASDEPKTKKHKNKYGDIVDTEEAAEGLERARDHEIIQMQFCLHKIFEYCSEEIMKNDELLSNVDELAYESQKLLGHDHSWVRCNAAQIIGLIISTYDFELIGTKLVKSLPTHDIVSTPLTYIYANPKYDIKCLVLDLCAQMVPGETSQSMIDEMVKIFLFIANMLRDVPLSIKQEQLDDDNEEDIANTKMKINLNWLIRNMRYLINKEVAKAPHCTSMRSAIFTLFEGLTTLLKVEILEKLAPSLLLPLVREMSEDNQNVDADLRQLALRVGSRIRKRIGSDVYDKLRTAAQTRLMIRRAERKRVLAQEKINDPMRAAKRKASMQERKKVAKKLKTSVMRGKVQDVKQKIRKRKRKADDDFI